MLPRRNSKNPAVNYIPPRPTSGFVGGTQPLGLITTQQTFRAQALKTEIPQSETSPQETPPLPHRPTSFPHLPPGGGGLRRQSTRRSTYETCSSALEEQVPVPSQPPNIMPTPTSPLPQSSEPPPPTPVRPHQRAPGGGVGGFTAPPSPHHGSSRGYSHHSTADYTYRFDTSPRQAPDYESPYITGGIHAKVWPTYNKISREFDKERFTKWDADLDVLLIFAALFSAIVATFLTRALDDLEPNYQQQSALLLHQLLNGRDPNLANISDPTISFMPSGSAIAVNCLWSASLSISLSATFAAMICKEWLTEYTSGANQHNGRANPVVDLLRACQRQVRFMAFQRWNVHALVALLPPLLHSSVLLFFAGAVVYLWQMDERVAIVCQVIGSVVGILYFILTFLPFATDIPFRPYSTLLFHRLSVAIGKVVIPVVDVFIHACYLTLRYITAGVLWLFTQTVVGSGALQHWYMQAVTILPGEYKHLQVWWANALDDSLDEIDTSQRVQEEAVLWLSQMPLNPSESKAVVSSLALISSPHSHRFPKPVIVFLNLTLLSSFQGGPGQEQTDIAIDCVLVLGHIKFQSVVDRNSDHDHNVGGIPVTASVAWAAQQLTINAFQEEFNTLHSEGIRVQLLTAAAWLSPVDAAEDVQWDSGEILKIQDRHQFLEEIRITLLRHVNGEKVLDSKVLIDLIHGMHACIPRGNYGSASSIVSFLPLVCEDYDSPWSEDEAVLRALITYCMDLLSPSGRGPLVEREVEFNELVSELIDTLVVNATSIDVVAFGFWLIYRVPYAFKSRKTMLVDIVHIWDSAIGPIQDDAHRQRLNLHAVDAFVAVAQCHASVGGALPKFARRTALKLLDAALDSDHTRPMGTYAIAMILNLGRLTQVATLTNKIKAEPLIETLFHLGGDLESNTVEEDVVDLRIYSTLVLLKLRRRVELDVERVRGVIGRMERTIGDPSVRDSGVARRSEVDISADLDRVRWKAIYLAALLLRFVPDDERERRAEGLRERVQGLVRSGDLPLVDDNQRCLKPLGTDELELWTPAGEQYGPTPNAFEVWAAGFPLFPLAGSVALVEN